jgi:hypothetical protein
VNNAETDAARAWLMARLDEGEPRAGEVHHLDCGSLPSPGYYGPFPCDCGVPEGIRRDVEAKRKVIEGQEGDLLGLLALPFADRPDFPDGLRLP